MAGAHMAVSADVSEAVRALEEIEKRLGNLKPAMRDIGEYMLRETEEHFSREQDPDGRAWAALTQKTRRYKKHGKILTESGHLRGGIRYRAGRGQVSIGTDLIYAAVHQLGSPSQGIPARPYLGVNTENEEEIRLIVEDYLLGE